MVVVPLLVRFYSNVMRIKRTGIFYIGYMSTRSVRVYCSHGGYCVDIVWISCDVDGSER